MRLRHLLVLLLTALTLAACASPRYRIAPAPVAPVVRSDLDMRMYGGTQRTAYVQPQSYVVRRVTQVVATVEEGPYTLDTGDKLRIVVFGQDTLSNSYTVDAEGRV